MTQSEEDDGQMLAPKGWAVGGALIGVFTGYVLGSSYGPVTNASIILFFGAFGSILANEAEYQWLKKKYTNVSPLTTPHESGEPEAPNVSEELKAPNSLGQTPSFSNTDTHIIISLDEDSGQYTVIDKKTGIATQGDTREEAVRMFSDAVELVKQGEEDTQNLETPNTPWFSSNGSTERV